MVERQDNLEDFIALLDQPETSAASLLWEGNASGSGISSHHSMLQKTCQLLFQRIEGLARTYGSVLEDNADKSLSGLRELYVGAEDQPVDAETLWGQVALQNDALQSLLKKSLKKLTRATVNCDIGKEIRLLQSDDESEEGADDVSNHDNKEEGDEEERRIRARMERAMADMESEDDEEVDLDEEGEARRRTRDHYAEDDDEGSVQDPVASELNDGFFDIREMEAFADEEEEYLPDDAYGPVNPENDEDEDKKSFHQKQRDGDLERGSDDEEEEGLLFRKESFVHRRKYRKDDEIDALYSLYDKPEGDDDVDIVNMTAQDIFGKPKKKYYDMWNSKKAQDGGRKGTDREDDEESWNDYNFDDHEGGPSGWSDGSEEYAADDKEQFGKDDARDVADDAEDEEVPMKDASSQTESRQSRQSEKLRLQTEWLEKEMLAEKPWQMTGETTGTSRPVNSLLEATPEFVAATKMAPSITIDHTVDLEEVIKRRILNEDWDDVIPRELPDVGWHKKRSELPEVSQEKSKLGLGELYEREYLKKAVGYDADAVEKETEEEKAKNEMKALFANLCSKLDALSNYHFAPRPIADEAEVRAVTQPAIAMEEVLPLHVSDARSVAPEEVFGAKRGREGVLRGDSEFDQQERKRLRASKKVARRKARKEKLADEKLILRLQPGLGLNNPYEKRKMREELSVARARGNVTSGEADTNDYGASDTFFKRMQEDAQLSIRGQKESPRKKKSKERETAKSSALKL